ncbi:hypothetical protein FJZ36_02840 [Candidatus Poribacteria bacterium]|nr:hypothetical protein [Candidatus Poribacteria bacterium]
MSRTELIESVVMILCIPALWPVVRSFRSDVPLPSGYSAVLAVVALVLGAITVRRIRRLRAAFRDAQRRTPPF